MTIPNVLSLSRLVLSPIFFVFFRLSDRIALPPFSRAVVVGVLTVIFFYCEASDLLDGWIARRFGLVSDLGKLLDPFSDAFMHATFFFCFSTTLLLPFWILMIILWREFGVLFLRLLAMKNGAVMAAGVFGKLKTAFYALASGWGMVLTGVRFLGHSHPQWWGGIFLLLAGSAAFFAVASFLVYVLPFCRASTSKRG